MAWDGKYWGPDGALKKARENFKGSQQTPADWLAFASACYSAATRALAEIKGWPYNPWNLVWGVRAISLGWRAVWHVNRAWEGKTHTDFTLDQIDVSLSVWRRFSFMPGVRRRRTENLVLEALIRLERGEKVANHTVGLLLGHVLEMEVLKPSEREAVIVRMRNHATRAKEEGQIAQASRVWKVLGRYLLRTGSPKEAQEAFENANRLALSASASDQLVKILVARY